MARRGRRDADEPVLMALACGATVETAARSTGVSPRTIRRRLNEPAFQRRLRGIRDDMVQRTAALLTAAATEAVKTMLALQDAATPPAVRLGAARAIVELGARLRDSSELAQRIAVLEEQFKAAGQAPGDAPPGSILPLGATAELHAAGASTPESTGSEAASMEGSDEAAS